MPVRMRLQRKGRKKAPFYHIVVADARAPRDGKYIEKIGTYNPMTKPATIELDREKAFSWLQNGAQPSETVRSILRFKGVLYRKHLERGVKKGAMTQDEAMVKYQEWIDAKEAKIEKRKEAALQEKLAFQAQIDGVAPPKAAPVEEAPAEEVSAEAATAEADNAAATENTEAAPAEDNKEEA